jgi:SAM-dependent methyltransferase
MNFLLSSICNHWKHRGTAALAQLRSYRGGPPSRRQTPADFASFDQLHVGQLESTIAFAQWVGVQTGASILDLGAGLGGPARHLAVQRGASVWAVEVVPELHEAAVALTAELGLADRVRHELAELSSTSAVGPFDLVWLEHVDMHVPDKRALYRSAAAPLHPDGRIVWHDWLAGPGGPPHWPLFWSPDGAISFLSTRAEFADDLARTGLALRRFSPIRDATLTWLDGSAAALSKALDGASGNPGPDEAKVSRLRRLLAETDNARRSVTEERLVPFFAEAELAR